MRALRRSFLLLAPVALATIGVFACEQDSPNQAEFNFPETGITDTTQQPPNDSSTPLPDSPVDVAPKPVNVSVTITTRSGQPKPNITVVFHDQLGAVVETKTTGANGTAISTGATTPAMATALVGTPNTKHLVTWTGLEGGDQLLMRDLDDSPFVGNFVVSFPYVMTDAGATFHEAISNECSVGLGDGSEPVQLPLYANCVRPTNSVLAIARDEGNLVVGYSFKKGNIAPTDGGDVPVLTGDWNPPTTTTVTLANPPASGSLDLRLLEIAEGYGYDNRATTGIDDGSAPFKTATGFADAIQGNAIRRSGNTVLALAKRQALGATVALDYAQALPAINSVTKDANDARRPSFGWTPASPLTASDGGIVRVRFFGPEDANYFWTFVVAPGATNVKAPALPAAADAWLAQPDAGPGAFGEDPEILFIESDLLPGYAQFRAQQGVLLNLTTGGRQGGSLNVPTLPQNGTLRATAYEQGS